MLTTVLVTLGFVVLVAIQVVAYRVSLDVSAALDKLLWSLDRELLDLTDRIGPDVETWPEYRACVRAQKVARNPRLSRAGDDRLDAAREYGNAVDLLRQAAQEYAESGS